MRSGLFSALFLAILVGAAAPAQAQRTHGQGGVQPLDSLLPEIRRQHPGNFYDAEGPTFGPNGDPHYHLKWMTPNGRVIWLDTDARSGRVLRSSPGRDSFGPPGHDSSLRGAPPAYEQPGRPGARDPNEDRYRGRFGGSFESRPGYDRPRYDRQSRDRPSHDRQGYEGRGYDRHGPTRSGPRAGDFGRRGGGRGRGHR